MGEFEKKKKLTVQRQEKEKEAQEPFFSSKSAFAKQKPNPLIESISLSGSDIPSPTFLRTSLGISAVIYFGKDNILLDNKNLKVVQKLRQQLQLLFQPKVILEGHSSQEGKSSYNKSLSERRRDGVIAMFNTVKRTPPLTYEGKGYGETQPAVPEIGKTEAERETQRKWNRRVEVYILFDPSLIKAEEKEAEKKRKPTLRDLTTLPPETTKRIEEEERNRRLTQPLKIPPLKRRSVNDMIWGKIYEGADNIMRKWNIPPKFRPWIKKGLRSAVEKGVETLLDKALSQTSLDAKGKKALKSALKAAAESKIAPE